jgi:hypothetical protein
MALRFRVLFLGKLYIMNWALTLSFNTHERCVLDKFILNLALTLF